MAVIEPTTMKTGFPGVSSVIKLYTALLVIFDDSEEWGFALQGLPDLEIIWDRTQSLPSAGSLASYHI